MIVEPDCKLLTQFDIPQGFYETLFNPTIMANFRELTSLVPLIIIPMLPYGRLNFEGHSDKKANELAPLINKTFFHLSRAQNNVVLGVTASIYRLTQLATCRLQHKIEQSDLSQNQKFIISGLASTIPLIIMRLIGASYQEIALCALVKYLASYSLPKKYSNFIKELDLVSKTRYFTGSGFVVQNVLTMARNLITSILVADFLLLYSFRNLNSTDKPETPILYMCQYYPSPTSQERVIKIASEGKFFSPLTYLIDECGWMLGKIAVDGVMILLKQCGVIKDLRDPFKQNPFKPNIQPTPIIQPQPKTNHSVEKGALPSVSSTSSFQSQFVPSYTEPSTESTIFKKIKTKKMRQTAVANIEKPIEQKKLNISTIVIPNYTEKLIALNGEGVNMISNLWGLATYDFKAPNIEIKLYLTSLETGHIGAKQGSSMKYLGKHKTTGQSLYEIKPRRQERRLVGTLIRGEDDVYRALSTRFGYERAMALTEQMKVEKDEINLIDFNQIVTHEQLSQLIAH
jgi:hypothetical protein